MLRAHGKKAAVVVAVALLSGPLLWQTSAGAATFRFPNFSGNISSLNLNGAAARDGNVLRLTDAIDETASVFTDKRVLDPTKNLDTSFRFSLHGGSASPADGIAFVLQRDPRGANALGDGGSQLGYAGTSAITPSVAVEFDIYPSGDIRTVRLVRNANQGAPLAVEETNFDLYGGDRWAWITYREKTRRLKVYVDDDSTRPATALLTKRINLKAALGGRARAGFTGATGGEYAVQDIERWTFVN